MAWNCNTLLPLTTIVVAIGVVVVVDSAKINPANLKYTNPKQLYYSHYAVLDPDNIFHLSWEKDDKKEEVTFTAEVRTKGWIGFGISPNGGMINADIVIGWVDDSGKAHFDDRFATAETLPTIDPSQDWKLLSASENETHTIFQFSRPYRTCDTEHDRDLVDGIIRVIYAYGDKDPADKNSVPIHKLTTRGSKSLRLLMDNTDDHVQLEDDVEFWDITAKNSTIPAKETTYFCTLHRAPFNEKRHIVKYEALIQPGNEPYVHHLVLFRCQHPDPKILEGFLSSQDHQCVPGDYVYNMPPDLLHCRAFYIIWTVGGGPFTFPKEAGLSIGDSEHYNDNAYFYMLEVHYDNSAVKEGIVDNSGFRLYTTKSLRKYDADNYVMGSVEDYRLILPPRQPKMLSVGHCSPECHEDVMDPNGVNVMSVMVHGHLYTKRIKARHFRGNQELEPLVDEKHYDFNYQDYWHFPKPRKILPGDQVTVECYYDTSDQNQTILGGFQTSEEMCHLFIAYYPRMKEDRSCFSGLSATTIAAIAGVDDFEPYKPEEDPIIKSPLSLKGRKLSEYLVNKTDWDDDLIRNSLHLIQHAPRQTQCFYRYAGGPQASNHFTQNMIGYPRNLVQWEETKTCKSGSGGLGATVELKAEVSICTENCPK